ncbi:hypothetical protein GCM10008022_24330 [Paenibacillus hunanensis]|nr:hypothetical protein GCM10008022_24330 [Paenibacillus hunanensis]
MPYSDGSGNLPYLYVEADYDEISGKSVICQRLSLGYCIVSAAMGSHFHRCYRVALNERLD